MLSQHLPEIADTHERILAAMRVRQRLPAAHLADVEARLAAVEARLTARATGRREPSRRGGCVMGMSSHQRPHRGATDEWLTPPGILRALGPFDLDPCAPVVRPWEMAETHYTIEDDGLARAWRGFVWCNPPFGPEAGRWLAKMAEHDNGIALVPARTETRWFVANVWQAARAVLFLHGRPHFHHPDGTRGRLNSGAPICLVGYGDRAEKRLDTCGLAGSLVSGWRREEMPA